MKPSSAANEVYLVSAAELSDADNADGAADRVVDLSQASDLSKSWKLTGVQEAQRVASASDVDFDGGDDVLAVGGQDTFVVPMASMQAADADDGQTDRSITVSRDLQATSVGAWRLTANGLERGVYALADTNADGHRELLIGAPMTASGPSSGNSAAYILSGSDWAAADALDSRNDGAIDLDQWVARLGVFKLTGRTGTVGGVILAGAGDYDGDGYDDAMVGIPDASSDGTPQVQTVHLLSGANLGSLDAADGATDGNIQLNPNGRESDWQLTGSALAPDKGLSTAGDVDADGLADLIVAANDGVYLIAAGDMAAADAADGSSDQSVGLTNALAQPGSYKFTHGASQPSGIRVIGVGDFDGDSRDDILVTRDGSSVAHLIASRDFALLQASNGVVNVAGLAAPANSWILRTGGVSVLFDGTASSGDLDGDGAPELILGTKNPSGAANTSAYLISTAELAVADGLDGATERSIALDTLARRWPR